MPEKEHNYHFYFYNLSDEDKAYIRSQPWVLTTYDVYSELESNKGTAHENAFRVRVTWGNNATSATYARELCLKRGIIENEPYDKQYEREYNSNYEALRIAWNDTTVKNGMPIETMARNIAITSTENAKALSAPASEALLPIASAICFVLPSAFSGLISFLIGFFRRPIIAAIREVE